VNDQDEPRARRFPIAATWAPAYVHRRFEIIWDAEGEPYGLCIDDRYYRVRLSPELRSRRGQWVQPIFEVRS
jgi:hypothetical protein